MILSQLDERVSQSGGRLHANPRALLASLHTEGHLAPGLREELRLFASAEAGLPHVVGGVRRDQLIRWDTNTTTWSGHDTRTGGQTQLRVSRPHPAPNVAARLQQLADVLAPVIPGVRFIDGAIPALAAPSPGIPLPPDHDGEPITVVHLARWLLGALGSLERWRAAGLCPPQLAPEELRDTGERLAMVCLTVEPTDDFGPAMRSITSRMHTWAPGVSGPLPDLISGLAAFPPYAPEEAPAQATVEVVKSLNTRTVDGRIRLHRDKLVYPTGITLDQLQSVGITTFFST